MLRKSTRPKSPNAGATLVETLLAVAILTIIMAAAGSTIYAATQSYSLTRQMQEDEYNLRLALLSISREVHRGVTEVKCISATDITGRRIDRLVLTAHDRTTEIEYILEDTAGDGVFTLRQEVRGGSTPVPFAAVQLDSFAINLENGRWLNIELTGRYGFRLKTTIAILRVS